MEYSNRTSDDERTEEADKVSLRIAEILSETAFSFSPNEYIAIHRKLFQGIYNHAGKIRDYNITKKEWVLDGATVMYGSASELRATLEYDFSQEKDFSYKGLSMDEIIHHCQTAHCGRYIPHFDFGAKPSPIVPYRHLPQSLSGMTADCRSLV